VRENIEKAITVLANESRVDLITLTPVFNQAAAEGKMLYYPLDTHWNAEGREIAARFFAAALKKRYSEVSAQGR
jgi:SGNH hydrolase-like domain, acetyltransferase AlgX